MTGPLIAARTRRDRMETTRRWNLHVARVQRCRRRRSCLALSSKYIADIPNYIQRLQRSGTTSVISGRRPRIFCERVKNTKGKTCTRAPRERNLSFVRKVDPLISRRYRRGGKKWLRGIFFSPRALFLTEVFISETIHFRSD